MSAPLTVVPVAADSELFDRWHRAWADATRHDQGDNATLWQPEELRVLVGQASTRAFHTAWAGLVDDEVVCSGWLQGSLVDNPTAADVSVTTALAHRGRGYAGQVLERVEAEALERGRTHLLGEVSWAVDDETGEHSPFRRWAQRHGYEVGLVDVQRRLDLPVDDALLDGLAAEAAERHAGYEVRSFPGPVPDDLAKGWAALSATLMTEAPTGEIEREPEAADVAGLREREATIAAQGRVTVCTAALSPDGEVVGYTDIGVTEHEPDRSYQWGTLVRGDHRGHRLGLALKAANLRLLQQLHPQVRSVTTWNADVNAHMIGVNERLRFRPVQRLAELQKRLG